MSRLAAASAACRTSTSSSKSEPAISLRRGTGDVRGFTCRDAGTCGRQVRIIVVSGYSRVLARDLAIRPTLYHRTQQKGRLSNQPTHLCSLAGAVLALTVGLFLWAFLGRADKDFPRVLCPRCGVYSFPRIPRRGKCAGNSSKAGPPPLRAGPVPSVRNILLALSLHLPLTERTLEMQGGIRSIGLSVLSRPHLQPRPARGIIPYPKLTGFNLSV